jgi:uncharacterized protein with PQ loop repeat
MSDSHRQIEAETLGEQKQTVKYLAGNPIVAIIVFSLVILTGGALVFAYYTFLREYVFKREPTFINWFIAYIVTSIITWVLIRYIFRVPITSAYSF